MLQISSTGRRTSTSNTTHESKVLGSGQNSSTNSITSFDGLAKFMLRSRSFLLRPSRSSSKATSNTSSSGGSGGGANFNDTNKSQNGTTNVGSNLFNRRRISFPINNNNGSGAGIGPR